MTVRINFINLQGMRETLHIEGSSIADAARHMNRERPDIRNYFVQERPGEPERPVKVMSPWMRGRPRNVS